MPTMSRPALDVKGGTASGKEVSFDILQMEILRHGKMDFRGGGHAPAFFLGVACSQCARPEEIQQGFVWEK